jgi:hypothetical protein
MDGRAFLDAVRFLLTAPSEVNRRAAAGSLYCAMLNEARDALERWGFVAPAKQPDVHDFAFARLYSVANIDLIRVGDVLKRVKDFRDLADDGRSSPTEFADNNKVIQHLSLVNVGIDLLDQIEADPARRAQAIADVRAAFP